LCNSCGKPSRYCWCCQHCHSNPCTCSPLADIKRFADSVRNNGVAVLPAGTRMAQISFAGQTFPVTNLRIDTHEPAMLQRTRALRAPKKDPFECVDCHTRTRKGYQDARIHNSQAVRCRACHEQHQENHPQCFYCGAFIPGEPPGRTHRDGFELGPQVPLCSECSGELPSLEAIWKVTDERHIYFRDPLPPPPPPVELGAVLELARKAFE
jgi:hypothetical protein